MPVVNRKTVLDSLPPEEIEAVRIEVGDTGPARDRAVRACDALFRRGIEPRSVSFILPVVGRGSPNSIQEGLNLWRTQRAKKMSEHQDLGLPHFAVEAMQKLVDNLRSELSLPYRDRLREMESRIAGMGSEIEDLQGRLNEAAQSIKDAESTITLQKTQIGSLDRLLSAEESAHAETRRHSQELRDYLDQARKNLAHAENENAALLRRLDGAMMTLLLQSAPEAKEPGWMVLSNSAAEGAADYLAERGLVERHPHMDWVRRTSLQTTPEEKPPSR